MMPWYMQTTNPAKRTARRIVTWIGIVILAVYCIIALGWLILNHPLILLAGVVALAVMVFVGWLTYDEFEEGQP